MSFKLSLAAAALLSAAPLANAAYNLARDYSGQNFFSAWDYYGKYDNLTNGDVVWVNQSVAVSNPQLTYINSAGNAIIKVDDTTTVPYNEKRNSVRLTSRDKFNLGTVMVFDALHVPYGCSVWGALWTQGINWPLGGEIDIFEAVNLMTANQMALHTESGCSQADGISQTGITQVKNCDNNGSNGAGCTVLDANTNSYGQPFAAAGGGVWVTEFATTGVNIWFFSRANVPASLSTDTIDVSTFGTPSASYPASSCDPTKYFSEQQIVIDITLCGDWSGVKSVLESTCPALNGTNTCYTTYVLDPKNYVNAYFELASVKVFASDPSAVVTASGVTQTVSAGGSGGSGRPSAASRVASNNEVIGLGALAFTAMLTLVLQL